MTFQTRMENVAREEGYEAGFDEGYEKGLAKNPKVDLSGFGDLIGKYGLAVDSKDGERMRLACKALFDLVQGRDNS